MIVKQAKEVARRWVYEEAATTPGVCGAFYHGSTAWLPDDAVLADTSDVDVVLVVADPNPPAKPGKLSYQDVLLDVSYLSRDELRSAEHVLSLSHLAGSFRTASVILDPSGWLSALQAAVSQEYARRRWVYRRCEHARDKILANLTTLDGTAPFYDQVMAWLFATGVTTHVLLVAGLKNPTVRRRYAAVRDLLADYGHLAFYDTLLEMLGCSHISRAQVEGHLEALAKVFDAAAVVASPFPFAADISARTRLVAIGGSRELIARGDHREAVFWIAVTYSRCQKILDHDGPAELRARFEPGYRRLLGDLGIASVADLARRSAQLRALLPRVWEVAEAIITANPDIQD